MRQAFKIVLPLVFLVGGLVAASFLFGGTRSAVCWQSLRAIAIESDDWGLAGFVPDQDSWAGLDRKLLKYGAIPEAYWLSTLEDSSMVGRLNRVLASHVGRDGHPAVLQPNYIMSSLSHEQDGWVRRDLPDLPPAYRRPGLWEAVAAGIEGGTWYPEYHGTWHYDPDLRMQEALAGDFARTVTGRGIMLFPGSDRAWELGAWRHNPDLAEDLDGSLACFQVLFGRPVNSVIAPDYHWDARMEDMWSSRNLRVIQGKREQINAAWGVGKSGRLRKYLERHWDRFAHPERTYLERNCRLEPVQAPDPGAVVLQCVAETRSAWAAGQPAIVESHRINFAHTDAALVETGLAALDRYLDLVAGNQSEAPVFLTDHEIAQLNGSGTSWRVKGGVVILRNATRSLRVLEVPGAALTRAAAARGDQRTFEEGLLVSLPAGVTYDLVP
ncbi:MAG: hypothetical protein ABFS42_01340 [Candidatus Krumholzibacteriota bacterium]